MKKLLWLLAAIFILAAGVFLGNSGVDFKLLSKNINLLTSQITALVSPSVQKPRITETISTAPETADIDPKASKESAINADKDMTVIAKFKGSDIYKWEAEDIIERLMASQNLKNRPYEDLRDDEKLAVVKDIATKRLLQKDIDDSKIAEEKKIHKNLKVLVNDFIQNEFLVRNAKKTVTPEKIKAHYDKAVKEVEGKDEFRIRNILIDNEDDANNIYQDLLKKPQDFAEIAQSKSKDSSSVNGGDIGYALQSTFVKEIEEAAAILPKGGISKPIKTKLGWNIIKLEDRRKANVTPFESIKDKVENELIQENIQLYLKSLLNGVNVELITNTDVKELPEVGQ